MITGWLGGVQKGQNVDYIICGRSLNEMQYHVLRFAWSTALHPLWKSFCSTAETQPSRLTVMQTATTAKSIKHVFKRALHARKPILYQCNLFPHTKMT